LLAYREAELRRGVVGAASVSVMVCGIYATSFYNYLLFHWLAEGFAIIIAAGIFLFAWNARHFHQSNYFLFIGIAFLFVGALDFVHTLTYKGMDVIPGYGANLPTQLWIAARYLQSIAIAAALFMRGRRITPGAMLAGFIAVFTILMLSIFYFDVFPDCYIEGIGLTRFKIISEYIICLILAGAIVLHIMNARRFSAFVLRLILLSLTFTILSELAFTLYASVYDTANLIGHLLKILSYYMIYRAILVRGLNRPFDVLFRELMEKDRRLARSEAAARALLDAPDSTIVLADADGTIVDLNNAAVEHFNCSRDDIIGTSLWRHLGGEALEGRKKRFDTVLSTGEPVHFEVSEGDRWFSDIKYPIIGGEGKVENVALFINDITERKRAEEQLNEYRENLEDLVRERTAELEDAGKKLIRSEKMAAIARLSISLSHEIKNPLAIMKTHSEVLRSNPKIEGLGDEDITYSLDVFERHIDRITNIVNNLRMLSQDSNPVVGEIDLAEMAEDLRRLFRPRLEKTEIEFRILNGCGEDRPKIEADRGQLMQVMTNIIFNAIESMEDKGTITLEMRDFPSGESVEISVADTGCGISGDDMAKIFEPFFTTKPEGTGMGMPVIRNIVESHNGSIDVSSSPGGGTTITLRMPVRS